MVVKFEAYEVESEEDEWYSWIGKDRKLLPRDYEISGNQEV